MTQFLNGVHAISSEAYHASDAISRSNLMDFRRTPYHYWYNKLSGLAETKEPTPAMILGELVHTAILEPQELSNRFWIYPELDKLPEVGLLKDLGRAEYDRQKAEREKQSYINKEALAAFERNSAGKTIIKSEDLKIASLMAESVSNHEIAQSILKDSKIEQSIFFTHEQTGIQCKARPDIWKGHIVGDLKTTDDASYRGFQRSAIDYGYFIQAGMMDCALKSLGLEMNAFVIIAVEKKRPNMVAIYTLDIQAIDYGIMLFNKLMWGVAECMEKNEWPGYETKFLNVPAWALNDQQEI